MSASTPGVTADAVQGVRALVDAFRLASQSLDLDRMLHGILDGVSSLLEYDAAGIYIVDPDTGRLKSHLVRGCTMELPKMQRPFEDQGVVGRVLASGEPVLVESDASNGKRITGRASARSEIVVPIVGSRGRTMGALIVKSDRDRAYNAVTLDLLALFASAVAGSLESALLHAEMMVKRHLENELAIARQVMEGLLPRTTPRLEGFDVAGVIETSYEVGGDYYEFIPLRDDHWGLVIADVVGKGIGAALMVSAIRASIASLAGHELALRAIMRRANRFFHESVEEGKFVTLFYAVIDVRVRRLIYVNAGHWPPVLLRRNGDVELLEEGGFPLGLFDEPRYFEGFARLRSGDLLALFTDGIVETMDASEREYGRERLTKTLSGVRSASAAEICETVMQDVRRFGGSPAIDDQTLVVLKAT